MYCVVRIIMPWEVGSKIITADAMFFYYSMGDRDYVKPLLTELGSVHFGRVCMKPGKPLMFASIPAPPSAQGDHVRV